MALMLESLGGFLIPGEILKSLFAVFVAIKEELERDESNHAYLE